MNKKRKIVLGTLASIVVVSLPIVAVVSCDEGVTRFGRVDSLSDYLSTKDDILNANYDQLKVMDGRKVLMVAEDASQAGRENSVLKLKNIIKNLNPELYKKILEDEKNN